MGQMFKAREQREIRIQLCFLLEASLVAEDGQQRRENLGGGGRWKRAKVPDLL